MKSGDIWAHHSLCHSQPHLWLVRLALWSHYVPRTHLGFSTPLLCFHGAGMTCVRRGTCFTNVFSECVIYVCVWSHIGMYFLLKPCRNKRFYNLCNTDLQKQSRSCSVHPGTWGRGITECWRLAWTTEWVLTKPRVNTVPSLNNILFLWGTLKQHRTGVQGCSDIYIRVDR